ncbi:hypothetical protein Pmani_013943 [Petrolisthes manimaculis]|uniref:Uncharacterized protein n=1 Tax=Petrolisthes manimaculis TaxID=1843537 RepID=A0AAE1PV54_9EUCA|nr:hypothetical protein Pmani_013943 [Petrolisthes manimaculis]
MGVDVSRRREDAGRFNEEKRWEEGKVWMWMYPWRGGGVRDGGLDTGNNNNRTGGSSTPDLPLTVYLSLHSHPYLAPSPGPPLTLTWPSSHPHLASSRIFWLSSHPPLLALLAPSIIILTLLNLLTLLSVCISSCSTLTLTLLLLLALLSVCMSPCSTLTLTLPTLLSVCVSASLALLHSYR